MANSSKRDARKLASIERRAKNVALRKAGASFEQIATQLGYSDRGRAYHDFQAALKAIEAPGVEELRKLELERLDALQVAVWPKAISERDLKAMLVVIRIMERRSALMGLDAPRRTELSASEATPEGRHVVQVVLQNPPPLLEDE